MAYKKTVWEDRQVELPMTFIVTKNNDGTVTLVPYPGTIGREGTKFTADRMNNIENGIATGSAPTGSVLAYAGENAPEGWILCDGTALNRTDYADLFDVIGTKYGGGDGISTFNVPNMKGRTIVGLNTDGAFNELGKTVGEENHVLTINEMPSHDHPLRELMAGHGATHDWAIATTVATGGGTAYTNLTGGNQPHNNIQPSLVLNYIIKI